MIEITNAPTYVTDIRGVQYVEGVAYLKLTTGEVFQVLNADGSDWDEETTHRLYDAWVAKNAG